MSCLLTAGLTINCKNGVGGLKSVRFIQLDLLGTVAPLTTATGDLTITSITPTGSNKFWLYNFREETGNYQEAYKVNSIAGLRHYEQTLTLRFDAGAQSQKAIIHQLGAKNLAAIVEDNNGRYWLAGEEYGMKITDDSSLNSGTAFGDDETGYSITLKAMEPLYAREVTSSIVAGLTNS